MGNILSEIHMSIRLYIDAKIGCIIMIHSTLVVEITANMQSQESEKSYIMSKAKANRRSR